MRYLPLLLVSSLLGAVEIELDQNILRVHIDDAAGYRVVATTIHDSRGDVQLRKEVGKTQIFIQITYVDENGHRRQEFKPALLSAKSGPIAHDDFIPNSTVRSYGISQIFPHPTRHAYASVSYLCLGGEGTAPTTWPDGFTFIWLGADHK